MLLCNSWWYFKPGQFDVSVKDIKLWMDVPSNLFYILTLEYFKQQRKKTLEQIVWSSCQQAWRFKRNWMNLQWCSVLDTWNSSRVSFCSRLLNYHSYLCFFCRRICNQSLYTKNTSVSPTLQCVICLYSSVGPFICCLCVLFISVCVLAFLFLVSYFPFPLTHFYLQYILHTSYSCK